VRNLIILAALDVLVSMWVVRAPVPKCTPPEPQFRLTSDMVVGSWSYEWSTSLDGWIEFSADGTYRAQHNPTSTCELSGKWEVKDQTITLHENGRDYKFVFQTCSPKLIGLSNGDTHVALGNHRR
jgi:hypothetical protein